MADRGEYSDALLREILATTRVIAMVGASPNPVRPSFFAMAYLQSKGFRVIPVNPGAAGATILGETVHAALGDIAEPVDMVDVFRRADSVPEIARQAVAIGARVLWLQLGIVSDEGRRIAEDGGLAVVMDRCPKIEYARLHGELGWSGINSRLIGAKRRRLTMR